jgi:hypothetical protein
MDTAKKPAAAQESLPREVQRSRSIPPAGRGQRHHPRPRRQPATPRDATSRGAGRAAKTASNAAKKPANADEVGAKSAAKTAAKGAAKRPKAPAKNTTPAKRGPNRRS